MLYFGYGRAFSRRVPNGNGEAESEECLTRFAEISYSAGNLTAADKKLKEYKRETDYKGLSLVHSRRISDVAKLWNRLYRYCDADTKEWVRALMLVGEKQYQRKVFSFQDYGFGIEMVRAWMHLEEYSKALDFLNYIIEETESRLISPGPELVETDSLKGEILFLCIAIRRRNGMYKRHYLCSPK